MAETIRPQPQNAVPLNVETPAVFPDARLALSLLLLFGVVFSALTLRYAYDDAYITYRYAYNFATGHGFVYNVGERYLGTSAPLYGLLLGVFGWFHPDSIPLFGGLLCGLALTLTGLGLYRLGQAAGKPFCGLLAGLLFIVNPFALSAFSGEMLMQAALIVWAFALASQQKTIGAAILLAAAILVRPDALLAALVLGLSLLLTRRRFPARETLVLAAILLPFLLASWAYYGTPLPGTMASKVAQTRSGNWGTFGRGCLNALLALIPTGQKAGGNVPMPFAALFLAAALLGLAAVWRFRFWLPLLAWSVLFALVYHLAHLPFYHWYLIPVALALCLLAACALAALAELAALRWREKSRLVYGVALLLIAPLLLAQIPGARVRALGAERSPVRLAYSRVGDWLALHSPPNASVGYIEIGFLGYTSHRTMIDPLGLVNPGVSPHVAQGDFTWAYAHYRPDYILENPHFNGLLMNRIMQSDWFRREYAPVTTITQPGVPPLTIYRRQPGNFLLPTQEGNASGRSQAKRTTTPSTSQQLHYHVPLYARRFQSLRVSKPGYSLFPRTLYAPAVLALMETH